MPQTTTKIGWVEGITHDGYSWQAKVFAHGSNHGIGGGRISKLIVWNPWALDKTVYDACANYDRGWDIYPDNFDLDVVFRIVLSLS